MAKASKEDWRERKALEEARKAGTVAPEKDEDGKDINPHIPQYIADAPWYLNRKGPGLKHQKAYKQQPLFDKEWYQRGIKGPAATKFRKGACTNCGAMTHTAKFCVDRPRKVGARWTGEDIKPDEVVQSLLLDYDGKRDRWNGYDPAEHKKVMDQFEKLEHERMRKKKAELDKIMHEPDAEHKKEAGAPKEGEPAALEEEESDSDLDSDKSDDEDDFKDHTEAAVGVKRDARTRTTVRNLRIREDTAKYLLNLDMNSAYYDPKSGSMRDNPTPSNAEAQFQGDNFVRFSGDVNKFYQAQTFSFTAGEKGQNVHLQGLPSMAEQAFKSTKEETETAQKSAQEEIMAKYGGKEHLGGDKRLLLAQSEEYVEYSREGRLLKGSERDKVVRSKYEEDVLILNHTKVWGSYWEDGHWGYACCCQTVKNSYCTGKAGVDARAQVQAAMLARKAEKPLAEQQQQAKPKKKEETEEEKKARFQKALKEEDARARGGVEKDDRKRAYNSLKDVPKEVTEEEMEAYRMKRVRADDPMAAFLNKSG